MEKLSQSQGQRRVARVYDIKDCGPRNRFAANGVLVHNSGGDKMNYQNMGRGSKLRDAIQAPDGDVIIVGDSSNIESRVLDWLAGQTDAVEVYRKADAKIGPDVYCVMAEKIYNRPINKTDNPDERQLGKVAKLGLGYGMGYQKFIPTVRVMAKRKITEAESQMVVQAYRSGHPMVLALWKRAGEALKAIINGRIGIAVDYRGIIRTCEGGLLLPNGMTIRYPDLQVDANGEFTYFNGRTRERVYGGKVVENCISGGTLVLTDHGWVPIESVSSGMRVWDGVAFVQHGGIVYKGVQGCVAIDGVHMTHDHEVLTHEGWKPALACPEPVRATFWRTHRLASGGVGREEGTLGISLPVWVDHSEGWSGCSEGGQAGRNPELRVPDQELARRESNSRDVPAPGVRRVGQHGGEVPPRDAPCVQELWGTGDFRESGVAEVCAVLGRHGADVPSGADARPEGQQPRVREGELQMGWVGYSGQKPQGVAAGRHPGAVPGDGDSEEHPVLPVEPRPVFDILNCGPRQRFVVAGVNGPFIVHNCVQALSRIIVMYQTLDIHKYNPVKLSVHDEAVALSAEDDAKDALAGMLEDMRKPPEWAPDLPLNSEGGYHKRYGKAKK